MNYLFRVRSTQIWNFPISLHCKH